MYCMYVYIYIHTVYGVNTLCDLRVSVRDVRVRVCVYVRVHIPIFSVYKFLSVNQVYI